MSDAAPSPPPSRLRRIFAAVLDSPTTESDAREVLAGWRLGLWMMLVIALAALGTFTIAGNYFTGTRPFPLLVARHGIGALLVAGVQLSTIGFLTLAMPLRASGLLEGPRWRGYFDQLVASGLEPWRYFAGRALVSQSLIALSIAATLPLVALFWILDAPPLGPVLVGYALIVAWAELLLAISLAAAALLHEAIAVLGTIAFGAALTIAAYCPAPTTLVALSPVRWIVAPFAGPFADSDALLVEFLYGAPRPFGVAVPYVPYALALTGFIIALAAAACVFGPLSTFVPGFNNFGTVVLPGDRGRASFRRVRPLLQRRVELAFFFENRGPLLTRLAPWARLAQTTLLLLAIGVVPIAAFVNGPFVAQMFRGLDEIGLAALVPMALAPVLVLGPLLVSTTKNDAHVGLPLGGLRLPVVLVDIVAYALVLVVVGLLCERCLASLLPGLKLVRMKSAVEALGAAREWIAILSVVSFTALLIGKSVGLRSHASGNGLVGVIAVGVVCIALAARAPNDLVDRDEKIVRTDVENARVLAALHLAWPLRMAIAIGEERFDGVRLPQRGAWRFLAWNGFWAIYPALDLAQLLVILTLLRKRRREVALERAALEASVAPPAPEVAA